MRHVYQCPVRWADLDLLGHVNNAVYVDYLQEARADMLRAHGGAGAGVQAGEGMLVVSHSVDFVAPLRYRDGTVSVECWVTELRAASFTLAYEIYDEHPEGDGRTVYVRAATVVTPFVFTTQAPRRLSPDERAVLTTFLEPVDRAAVTWRPPRRSEEHHHALHTRFSDLDLYGHVNNVKYVEYFQEARIPAIERWVDGLGVERPRVVVASTTVEYLGPLVHRSTPYDVWTWPVDMGTRSVTLQAEIADGDRTMSRARVVLVFVDEHDGDRSTEPPAVLAARLRELSREP